MNIPSLGKEAQLDGAEFNAFFPSPSLKQFTEPFSGLKGTNYPQPYRGKRRILVICTDERYLATKNGTLFATGNHPVEMLVPMYHLHKAGFGLGIATISGNPVKFELWAMPKEDQVVIDFDLACLKQFRNPLKLADVVAGLGQESDYAALFIPGGHGPLVGVPFNRDIAATIRWAINTDRHIISICHGPAAFLACATEEDPGISLFTGYSITAFPDATYRMIPDIGYLPGQLILRLLLLYQL